MAKSDDILKKYGITQVKGSEGSSNKAATTTSTQKATGNSKADAILAKYGIIQGTSTAKGSTIAGNKSTDSRYHDIITANDYAANSRYKTTKTDNLWEKMWSQYGMGYSDLTYEYVNNQDGIRDEVKRKSSIYKSDSPFSDDEVTYEEKGYDFMTEEEIGVYNYYYNKEGKERAQAFLDSLEDTLVKRKAGKEFTNLDGSIGKEYLYGIVAGAEQFTSGVENIGDFITGDKGSTPSSQYVSEMIRQDLADDGPKVLGSSVGQIGYDIINTTSNMLPSILVGAVTGPVGGAVAMGGSVVGNSYQEMLRLGYNTNQARAYAALTGASEATLQYLLGGISKLGGKLSGNVVSKLVSKVDNAIARVAIDLGGNMISEGVEESVQTVLEPVFKAFVTGEDFEGVDIEEVLYSGLLGALSAGFLESGGKVAGNTVANLETKQTGKSILESEGSVDALKQLANEVAGVSSADMQQTISDQIAKVDKKQSAIQVGKLYNTVQSANDLANASANQADIAKSLERKGFSAQEAKAAAEAIVAKYNGQELTKAQEKTIKSIKGNEAVQGAISNIINNPKSTMGQRSDNIRNFNRDVNNGIIAGKVKKIAEGKLTSAEEKVAESHYEVSADGQTIDKDGNAVSIQGIASLENGRMVLKTENGTVDAGDVSYGSQAEALVYEAVSKLEGLIDTDTANRLSKHLLKLGDASSDVYARGIVQAYTYGYYGYGREAMLGKNTLSATLTEKQRNVAYGLGEQYRDAKTKADQEKAKTATVAKNATTGKATAPDGTQYQKVRFEGKVQKWDEKQQAEVAFIDFIASNFSGNTVRVFESYKTKDGKYVYEDSNGKIHSAPNGMYFDSNGDIYLDLNAGNHGEGLIMNTFAHELYHHIQKQSPAKARKLAEFLVQELGYESVEAAVRRQIAKAEAAGHGVASFMAEGMSRSAAERMVYDRAFNDFVADSLETMFTEGDAVGKLQKLKSQDEGLFNMIKNFIDKWVKKLREFYSGHNTISIEGDMVRQLEKFDQIQQMFVEALVDAGENFKSLATMEENTDAVPVEEVTQYSYRSLAEAAGFEAVENEDGRFFTRNGARISEVTVEDIENSPIGAMINYSLEKKDISFEDAKRQKEMFAKICTMACQTNDFSMTMQFVGSAVFTGMKANADKQYGTTYDFPSICTKTQAVIDAMSKRMVKLGRGLSSEELVKLYQDVFASGNPVPCPECYVFSRWIGIGGLLDNIKKYQDYYGDMAVEDVAKAYRTMRDEVAAFAEEQGISFGKAKGALTSKLTKEYNKLTEKIEKAQNQGEKVKPADQKRLAELEPMMNTVKGMTWLENVYFADSSLKKVNPRFRVPNGVLFDLNNGEAFATQYKEAWAFRTTQGAGYGKAITPYAEARLGEGILVTNNTTNAIKGKAQGSLDNFFLRQKGTLDKKSREALDRARLKQKIQAFIGGQRFQSTSDARYENASDYLLAALEMQAMHGMVQVYTKVDGAVPALATWNYSINQSLMPLGGGLDANGNVRDTSVGGMNRDIAFRNREKFETAGTITIGVNDNHIRAMFKQWVRDFIIPYHASGGKADVVSAFRSIQEGQEKRGQMVRSTDYSRTQSDKVLSDEVLRWQGKTEAEIQRIHEVRAARIAILSGGKPNMDVVRSNRFLSALYDKLNGGEWDKVKLAKSKVESQIYPNEFWDQTVSYEDSGKITRDYLEYCDDLGFLHRFSGMVPSNGKLVPVKGYDQNGNRVVLTDLAYKYDENGQKTDQIEEYFWKVLTDRRMYDNQRKYLPQKVVNLNDTTTDTVTNFAKGNYGRQYDKELSMKTAEEIAGKMYSDRVDIVDVNGVEYDHVVELDYKIFNRVKRSGKAYIDFIRNNLIKQKITVYDDNGDPEVIEFAGEKERVLKDGAKNKHPVIGELTQAKNETKKLVILNAVETAEISRFAGVNNEHKHQWLDENGWEERTSHVMTKDGIIYPVTLHIARARDGRNILYDVNVKLNEGIAADKIATSLRAKQQAKQAVRTTKPSTDKVSQQNPEVKMFSDRVLMGSLFSGGGTLEAGLVYQMLDKEFAVEYNKQIAATYTDNHGNEHMFVGDVRDFNSKDKQNVFYLHASPVCKNFSPASHSGGETTLDIVTAQATVRVLEEQMPQVFTVENVKRYVGSEAYTIITDKLTELGYKWDVDVYKASDYGNATKRERMIIRAVKDGDLPAKPAKVSGITSWGEATRDLWETDLIPSTLVKSKIEAIRNTPALKNLKLTKLDRPLMIYDTTKSKQVTYAWADELAPTLTTKCGDARIIMPDGKVYEPTPKFMGRIQGLPDDYKYPKAKTNAFKIIGNGIPTQLTKAVVGGVLDSAYEQTHDGQKFYSDRSTNDESIHDYARRGELENYKGDYKPGVQESLYLAILNENAKVKKEEELARQKLRNEYEQKLESLWDSVDHYWLGLFGDWCPYYGSNDSTDIIRTEVRKEGRRWECRELLQLTQEIDKVNRDIEALEDEAASQVLYSERDTESVSNRSLLANAFEGMAQNDIERNKIQEYKSKIDLIEAEERKLQELNEKIREMSFAKGPRDAKAIKDLQFEAQQAANRINTYDKQLLRLEASKPLQEVLAREKKVAYQKAEKKGKEALAAYREKAAKTQRELLNKYQDARKTAVENREKTAMRHKVQNVVKELNDLLLNESKKRHVPDSLKKAVADALALVNMDTVGAEERAAKYAALIARETDPDKIDAYTATMENILRQGDKMGQRLKELRDAYEEIQESDDPDIANAYDPVIAGCLKELSGSIGNTSLRNMTIEQLSDVYDMYKMVLTRVRDANKTLLENIKENISSLASRVIGEVRMTGGEHKYRMAALDPVRKFLWNNLKPVYAMEHMGSSTLTKVFNNVRAGEDTWAKDVTEAREYYLDKAKKYGYNSWDFKKKYRFESASELEFELTLEQILSLYAYSKREQAHDHLRLGGFVFDSNIETYKDKDSKILKYKVNTADAHQITPEILASIIGKLSNEQMAFVDEMQDYLSTVMGAKGNEVTMKMYGVKLFKEKFYFPLKSAKQFMFEQNEVAGEVRIKNSGFTNKVVAKANNPVILSNFMDVWSGHVNDMSMYHSFVLPLEDFNRVFNYNSPKKENQPPVSVKGTIQNAYSPAAVNYVKGLITDLNGGARTDSTTGIINKMMGLFKKGSVFASLSVVVQQPSAIARAAALVDTKYFIGPKVDHKRHKALWDEVKQYAPVAIIKEMGYFDTNMGKSTQDFILGQEYSGFKEKMKALVTDSGYRDEILSKAPALADEIAWCSIWEAVKRETKAKYKGLDVKSEPFLMLAGSRFTEVITKTQVYDSVLSRSANMRSKDTGMKMATAFMAEPTTSINMIADALLKGKRGDKKYCRAAIGAVIASQILNSILVSFVYAGRDDDEDETYWEKYIGTLSGEVIDSLNPAGYIPFIKDIQSIVQGYDVERSDMAVISDLWNAYQKLGNDNVSVYRKVEGFAGSIAQIFGLPVKNIMRDVRGIYQTIDSVMNGPKTTMSGIGYAVKANMPKWMGGGEVSDRNQLYEAMVSGDNVHLARVRGRFKDASAISSAIRMGLRENDPRIHEAAIAWNANDLDEYMRIAREVIAEKHFSQDDVVMAIRAEASKLAPDEESTTTAKSKGLFTAEKFAEAIAQDDPAMANAIKSDIIKTAQQNGKTADAAAKSFNESAKSELKEMYLAGEISEQKTVKALTTYCGADEDSALADVQYWKFKQKYPNVYADDSWFDAYYEDVADSGMDIGLYMEYRNMVKNITGGDKKEQRMDIIHSLPISSAQKDALYYAEGWAASRIGQAPWH